MKKIELKEIDALCKEEFAGRKRILDYDCKTYIGL